MFKSTNVTPPNKNKCFLFVNKIYFIIFANRKYCDDAFTEKSFYYGSFDNRYNIKKTTKKNNL